MVEYYPADQGKMDVSAAELEVDHDSQANGLPIPVNRQSHKYVAEKPVEYYDQDTSAPPARKRICGIDPVVLGLSIALAIMTIAFAVGTGVAGSLASKRAHRICQIPPPAQATCPGGATAIPISSTTSSSPSQTTTTSSGTSTASSTPTPSSDCASLPHFYTALSDNNQTFNIDCETDYPGDDLIGVYVYTFEACIEACASYNARTTYHQNSTCFGVSFDTTMDLDNGGGNCWLKDGQSTPSALGKKECSSAIVSNASSGKRRVKDRK